MRTGTLWEFGLALVVLWLVMEYIPEGIYIGVIALLLVFIETPAATKATSDFLSWIQHPTVSTNNLPAQNSNVQAGLDAILGGAIAGGSQQ